MPVPKRKISKTRSRRRRASKRYQGFQLSVCTQCGKPNKPHCVCAGCGYYKNQPVLTIAVEG